MSLDVTDNAAQRRFELGTEAGVAVVAYRQEGRRITFTHTEVPRALRGKGVGEALARGALQAARARGLEVIPQCPFMAAYIRRHPEFADLVVDGDEDE